MIATRCTGLDGSNPLHFLASLGVLRNLPEGSTLSWFYEGAWRPSFTHIVENLYGHLSNGIRRGVPELGPVHAAYGFLGFSTIPKVPPSVFRAAAAEELKDITAPILDACHPAWQLSSLNAESPASKDGLLEPSAFSFSNKGGGQELLKDFLAVASRVTTSLVEATLQGDAGRSLACTSLNWDPSSLRNHAHQWDNPESQDKVTDVAANALAFMGLCCYPVVPRQRGSRTLGMVPTRKVFRWPIWEGGLGLHVVESLVTLAPEELDSRRNAGVSAIFESERFSSNKRLFFAPAVGV